MLIFLREKKKDFTKVNKMDCNFGAISKYKSEIHEVNITFQKA